MSPISRFAHALLLAGICVYPQVAPAAETAAPAVPVATKFAELPATPALLKEVRAGGFVLYMRHGYTDNSRPDRTPLVDLNDCETQRPLTAEGRTLAKHIGESIRKARLAVTEIHISPLCRVKETTAAAFPDKQPTIDLDLMYTANLTDAQKAPIIANTRRLLSAPVAAGQNRWVVAHAPNLMDLIGYFPKEGTVVVFKPKGEAGFEYLGSVPPTLWPSLLR